MALTEAMASGVASISVLYHDGLKDIIDDGVSGKIVENSDAPSLSLAMEELMNDSQLRERIGAEGQRKMQQFNLQTVGDCWESLFQDLK